MEKEQKALLNVRNSLLNALSWGLMLILASCGGYEQADHAVLDLNTWKNDQNGCSSERIGMVQDFEKVEALLLGKSELDIRKMLGRPDRVELIERSQKFYMYFLEAGSQCDEKKFDTDGKYMYIRFTSLNEVNEIGIKQTEP